jgi:4-hydroxy-2-oxoheptanedioate aldolase
MKTSLMNKLSKKVNFIDSKIKLGMFMKTSDPSFVEIASFSGFDFLIFDHEHGVTDLNHMQNLIRAAELHGTLPIVRLSGINESEISKVLDIGAKGIQVPQVKSKADVEKIIKFSKFFPLGERGVCRFVRAANYSMTNSNDYFSYSNQTKIIVQLEGKDAIDNIDSIIENNYIDVVFIGPYDLSQSLGVPGDIFNKIVLEKMLFIVKKCKEKNIEVGTFVDSKRGYDFWVSSGIQYLAYSVDVGLFSEKCIEILNYKRKVDKIKSI